METMLRFDGTRCRFADASADYRTMENSRSDNRTVDRGGNPRLSSARRLHENNEIVRRGVGLLPRDRALYESNARGSFLPSIGKG